MCKGTIFPLFMHHSASNQIRSTSLQLYGRLLYDCFPLRAARGEKKIFQKAETSSGSINVAHRVPTGAIVKSDVGYSRMCMSSASGRWEDLGRTLCHPPHNRSPPTTQRTYLDAGTMDGIVRPALKLRSSATTRDKSHGDQR